MRKPPGLLTVVREKRSETLGQKERSARWKRGRCAKRQGDENQRDVRRSAAGYMNIYQPLFYKEYVMAAQTMDSARN